MDAESLNRDWKVTPAKAASLITALSENWGLNMPIEDTCDEYEEASATDADMLRVMATVSAPVADSGTVMNTENEVVTVSVATLVSATLDTNMDAADTASDGMATSLTEEMKLAVAPISKLPLASSSI